MKEFRIFAMLALAGIAVIAYLNAQRQPLAGVNLIPRTESFIGKQWLKSNKSVWLLLHSCSSCSSNSKQVAKLKFTESVGVASPNAPVEAKKKWNNLRNIAVVQVTDPAVSELFDYAPLWLTAKDGKIVSLSRDMSRHAMDGSL